MGIGTLPRLLDCLNWNISALQARADLRLKRVNDEKSKQPSCDVRDHENPRIGFGRMSENGPTSRKVPRISPEGPGPGELLMWVALPGIQVSRAADWLIDHLASSILDRSFRRVEPNIACRARRLDEGDDSLTYIKATGIEDRRAILTDSAQENRASVPAADLVSQRRHRFWAAEQGFPAIPISSCRGSAIRN